MSRYDRYGDTQVSAYGRDYRTTTLAVYVLYGIALFSAVPLFIGVIIAYLNRGEARGTIWHAHFTWAIRTFWAAFLLGIVCAILSTPFTLWIGIPLAGLLWLWTAYRIVRGFMAASDRREPVRS